MDPAEARHRVQEIRRLAGPDEASCDDQAAHAAQDRLYRDVLRAIADGCALPRELAQAALETERIDFARWYA